MLVSTTKCMWWPWWAYSEVQWPYRAFASNTMTVSVVNIIWSTHQMQSPSVSSRKYGDVSWARYRMITTRMYTVTVMSIFWTPVTVNSSDRKLQWPCSALAWNTVTVMRECVVGMHTFRGPRDSLCAYVKVVYKEGMSGGDKERYALCFSFPWLIF